MDYALMPHHCAESLDNILSSYALEFFSCLFALHNPHKGDGERFAYGAANDHIALWDELPSALRRDLKKAAKSPSRRR